MIRVTNAEYLGDLRVRLAFNDGVAGIVDFRGRLDGPLFQPLRDPDVFHRFELTDHTLQRPNGADFAPEYLRDAIVQTDSTNRTMQQSGGEASFGLRKAGSLKKESRDPLFRFFSQEKSLYPFWAVS